MIAEIFGLISTGVYLCVYLCPQVLQMYLPFCGIAISNAQLFAASRKEYDRSRVRATGAGRDNNPRLPQDQQHPHHQHRC